MDLYSLHHSMHKVVEYLQGVDPPFAKEAMEAYSVLEPYQRDPSAYGRAMAQGQLRQGNRLLSGIDVQKRLEGVLTQLQRRNAGKYEYELRYTAEERLDAEINAEVVVNAESYCTPSPCGHRWTRAAHSLPCPRQLSHLTCRFPEP